MNVILFYEIRMVVFNLGYFLGGNKSIIIVSNIILLVLKVVERVLMFGGFISLVVYIGYFGGR